MKFELLIVSIIFRDNFFSNFTNFGKMGQILENWDL